MNAVTESTKKETARFNMIEQQIRTWEVLDPTVLQLLNDIPREQFVPAAYQGLAFADLDIPIGYGQWMLSPKLEGRMLQALSLKATDHVLHIGTGIGYFAALLAKLAKDVVSVEIEPALSAIAAQHLKAQHIQNVILEVGDAAQGWSKQAPYDVIVFGASSPVEPAQVRQQLTIGGRMLIILGSAPVMRATLIQRISEHAFREDVLFETCIAPLTNASQAQPFQF
ncbi:protein-L-isoaspartate carboxylmethyltransferase [Methylophilaceae bacterium 11]|nr:protein-L-isoaspartate carboxylmethyltransferase [Methylophilaceae bacterium 11]